MTITNDEIAVPAARTQRWRRADAPTVALHWLVAGLLLVSLATGFRVASDALDAGWSRSVAAAVAPQGAVLVWHIASACALIAAVSAYAMFLTRATVRAGPTRRGPAPRAAPALPPQTLAISQRPDLLARSVDLARLAAEHHAAAIHDGDGELKWAPGQAN
jgi:hypothetical protein